MEYQRDAWVERMMETNYFRGGIDYFHFNAAQRLKYLFVTTFTSFFSLTKIFKIQPFESKRSTNLCYSTLIFLIKESVFYRFFFCVRQRDVRDGGGPRSSLAMTTTQRQANVNTNANINWMVKFWGPDLTRPAEWRGVHLDPGGRTWISRGQP